MLRIEAAQRRRLGHAIRRRPSSAASRRSTVFAVGHRPARRRTLASMIRSSSSLISPIGPEEGLHVLHPLEVAEHHAAGRAQDVGQHQHAAVAQDGVGLGVVGALPPRPGSAARTRSACGSSIWFWSPPRRGCRSRRSKMVVRSIGSVPGRPPTVSCSRIQRDGGGDVDAGAVGTAVAVVGDAPPRARRRRRASRPGSCRRGRSPGSRPAHPSSADRGRAPRPRCSGRRRGWWPHGGRACRRWPAACRSPRRDGVAVMHRCRCP